MTSSFVDWPETNNSRWSSHLAISMNLETFISLIYSELFATSIPVQLQIMCAKQTNGFVLFFLCLCWWCFSPWLSSDTSVVHLAHKYAVIQTHVRVYLWSEGRAQSPRYVTCWVCVQALRKVNVRARSARRNPAPVHVGKTRRDDREILEASAGPASRHGQLTSAKTACH